MTAGATDSTKDWVTALRSHRDIVDEQEAWEKTNARVLCHRSAVAKQHQRQTVLVDQAFIVGSALMQLSVQWPKSVEEPREPLRSEVGLELFTH